MRNAISACVHWPVRRGTSLDATLAWGRLREDMAVLALAFDQRSRSLAATRLEVAGEIHGLISTSFPPSVSSSK